MKIEFMIKNGYCENCISLRGGQLPCKGLPLSKECPISVKEEINAEEKEREGREFYGD